MYTHISLCLSSMSLFSACSSAVISCLQSSKNGSSLVNFRAILSICLMTRSSVSKALLDRFVSNNREQQLSQQTRKVIDSYPSIAQIIKSRICNRKKGRHTRSPHDRHLPDQHTRSQTRRGLSQRLKCACQVSRQASPLIIL